MRGRPFVDVLDDALQARPAARPDVGAARHFAAPSPLPFLFASMPPPGTRARAAYVRASGPPVSAAATAPRSARLLTPSQQQAFDGLNALGGCLPAGFTAGELRAAYRQLAVRLHPDRHQQRGDSDHAGLARDFATAAGHYQTLLVLFPRH